MLPKLIQQGMNKSKDSLLVMNLLLCFFYKSLLFNIKEDIRLLTHNYHQFWELLLEEMKEEGEEEEMV
jgi:hypothetical protein